MSHYSAYIYPTLTNIKMNTSIIENHGSHINRLIDEANEYKFPTSYTIKKPDKYFLLVKKYS